MEDNPSSSININDNELLKLSLQSKSQLNFDIEYSKKISKLKIFLYGLRGVSLNYLNYSYIYLAWCLNFKKFNFIRNYSDSII